MPKELNAELPQPVEATQSRRQQFCASTVETATAGGARPQLIHTGEFNATGSSQTPTVNAAIEKVKPAGLAIPTACPAPESRVRSYTLPKRAPLICPQALAKATAVAGPRELKEL